MRRAVFIALVSILALPRLALAGDPLDSGPTLELGPISEQSDGQSDERYSISDQFGLRLGGQSFTLDLDPNYATPSHGPGSTFDSADAVVDYYPFRGNFRLSGGFLYEGGDRDDSAIGQDGITIGGLPFTPSQAGRYPGTLDFNGYTPYAGLGVQSTFWSGRLEFALDFGLQYQNIPGAEPGSEGSASAASAAVGERDAEDSAQHLDLLGFSPRAGLSLKLRF